MAGMSGRGFGQPTSMGAALTYARRYALFTLVGIAGEDDLDAPDIHETNVSSPGSAGHVVNPSDASGQRRLPSRSSSNGHARGAMKGGSLAILDADQSAALRDRLLGEIADIGSADQAASWARGVLTAKNSLTAADAKLVEDAFEQRLLRFSGSNGVGDLSGSDVVAAPSATKSRKVRTNAAAERSSGIDKSVLAVGAPRRYRNKDHLRFVAAQPCLICARKPSDPHHLRFMQPRALGRKVSDELYRFAGCIIARFTVQAMSPHGGRRPGSTRPRLHASFGGAHARAKGQHLDQANTRSRKLIPEGLPRPKHPTQSRSRSCDGRCKTTVPRGTRSTTRFSAAARR